jgi:hypothetical protein
VVQQQFRRLIHQIDIQLLMKVPTLFLQNGSFEIWFVFVGSHQNGGRQELNNIKNKKFFGQVSWELCANS